MSVADVLEILQWVCVGVLAAVVLWLIRDAHDHGRGAPR